MGDSDEEEMAAMRQSNRFGGGVSKKPTGMKKAKGSDSEDEPSKRVAVKQGNSTAADASDEEATVYVPEEPGEMQVFFPTAFGAKPTKKAGIEKHNGLVRSEDRDGAARPSESLGSKSGGVQFGPRLMDSATVAGATRRALRAQEEALAREEAEQEAEEAAASAPKPDTSGRRGDAQVDEDDDVPLPGQEKFALPVSHECIIKASERPVTAISFDPKASRMVTGGLDGIVRYYDFNGMTEEKLPFRQVEPVPEQGQHIQALSFGATGGFVLVILSDSHARIYDRDGGSKMIQSTVKGDMYVRDMSHTKGHTQMLTSGFWHPWHQDQWVTSSLDGTLRLWDLTAHPVGMDQVLPSVHVLKCLDKRGVCTGGTMGRLGGLHPTCCTISPADGKKIVAGCSDGSVQLFFEKPRYQKPDKILRTAHSAPVTDISFVGVGRSGGVDNMMVTRALDDTMKVWDCRMLSDAKGPVKTWTDLPCANERTGVCTSPDGRYIVTGTSFEKGAAMGNATVRVYDAKDFSHARTLDFGQKSCIRCKWPEEINQLVVGTSTGEVVMLYSPFSSKKGALHFIGRKAKKLESHQLEAAGETLIFNMTDKDDIKKFWSTGHGNMMKMRRTEARAGNKELAPTLPPGVKQGTMKPQSDGMAFAALALKAGAKRLNLNSTRTGSNATDAQKTLLSYQEKIEKKGHQMSLMGEAYHIAQDAASDKHKIDWTDDVSEGDRRMMEKMKGDYCRSCGQKVCRCVDYSKYGISAKKPRTT